MNKKLLAVPLILTVLAVAYLNMGSPVLYVFGEAVYNNDITHIEVWQYNGSDYNLVVNFTVTGGTTRIHDGWKTRFIVGIKFNDTLASSNAEAVSYTRVKMNITNGGSIWTNIELNNTSVSHSGSWYYLHEQGDWNASLPVAGTTYSCTAKYQGYY